MVQLRLRTILTPFTLGSRKILCEEYYVLSSTIMYLAQQIAADGIWD
jgi:hypothetical protein